MIQSHQKGHHVPELANPFPDSPESKFIADTDQAQLQHLGTPTPDWSPQTPAAMAAGRQLIEGATAENPLFLPTLSELSADIHAAEHEDPDAQLEHNTTWAIHAAAYITRTRPDPRDAAALIDAHRTPKALARHRSLVKQFLDSVTGDGEPTEANLLQAVAEARDSLDSRLQAAADELVLRTLYGNRYTEWLRLNPPTAPNDHA